MKTILPSSIDEDTRRRVQQLLELLDQVEGERDTVGVPAERLRCGRTLREVTDSLFGDVAREAAAAPPDLVQLHCGKCSNDLFVRPELLRGHPAGRDQDGGDRWETDLACPACKATRGGTYWLERMGCPVVDLRDALEYLEDAGNDVDDFLGALWDVAEAADFESAGWSVPMILDAPFNDAVKQTEEGELGDARGSLEAYLTGVAAAGVQVIRPRWTRAELQPVLDIFGTRGELGMHDARKLAEGVSTWDQYREWCTHPWRRIRVLKSEFDRFMQLRALLVTEPAAQSDAAASAGSHR